LVGNAILPGVGGLAGSLLADSLGVENNPESISAALNNASPAQLSKIKEMQLKHEQVLLQLALKQEELRLQDIQSARQREAAVMKETGGKDWNLYALAWTILAGFFVLCWFLMKKPLPVGQNEVVFMLFGALASGFGQVLTYFFGSSKSSSDKTKLLSVKKSQEV